MGQLWGFLFDVWHEEGCEVVHRGLSEQDGAGDRRDFRATREDPLLLTGLLALSFRCFAERWTMRPLTLCYWHLEQTYVNALLFF